MSDPRVGALQEEIENLAEVVRRLVKVVSQLNAETYAQSTETPIADVHRKGGFANLDEELKTLYDLIEAWQKQWDEGAPLQ